MDGILIAGLPTSLAAPFADRFRDRSVQVAFTGDEVMATLENGAWSLLVIDDAIPGMGAGEVLRWVRTQPHLGQLRSIYTLDLGDGTERPGDALEQLGTRLQPDQILLHPLDRGELLRHAAALLGAPAAIPERAAATATVSRMSDAIAAVWERSRGTVLERVRTLETAAGAIENGALLGPQRHEAEREAHRLAGSLGTFGFPEGSRLSFQAEALLGSGARLVAADGARLRELTSALRRELASAPDAPKGAPAPAAAPVTGRPLLLVVDSDRNLADLLRDAAAARELEVAWAPDPAAAREALARRRPSLVLLDLTFPGDEVGGEGLLREIGAAHPGLAVLVMTARRTMVDRVRAVQLGARGFLPKPFDPERALTKIARHLPPAAAQKPLRVLAVDDDPAMLDALHALLAPEGMEVHRLENPLRFWSALEESSPELVILDADMPHLNGVELCRILRGDLHRGDLPVLFLTAHTDAETVQRVFAAGADDYVPKPVVGPELVTRIRNRIDRTRALRG